MRAPAATSPLKPVADVDGRDTGPLQDLLRTLDEELGQESMIDTILFDIGESIIESEWAAWQKRFSSFEVMLKSHDDLRLLHEAIRSKRGLEFDTGAGKYRRAAPN